MTPLLAQLADIGDETFWFWFYVIGLSAPLLGDIAGWLFYAGRLIAHRRVLAAYFATAAIAFGAVWLWEAAALVVLSLALAGPILGMVLLLIPRDFSIAQIFQNLE